MLAVVRLICSGRERSIAPIETPFSAVDYDIAGTSRKPALSETGQIQKIKMKKGRYPAFKQKRNNSLKQKDTAVIKVEDMVHSENDFHIQYGFDTNPEQAQLLKNAIEYARKNHAQAQNDPRITDKDKEVGNPEGTDGERATTHNSITAETDDGNRRILLDRMQSTLRIIKVAGLRSSVTAGRRNRGADVDEDRQTVPKDNTNTVDKT
ncbi:hypothetical protein FGM00_11205 [Aggregatimonas sangjinii]|uniref:Uncharacterized protein n=1 Tax=Aggregatimonas sangjinii TaxID=2583587 RepID=A0A5B7SVH3_9FLAO|nr:hypothetical protein [Aggregatimonas sangjinii]QCX00644.1 hypothetical protein FGM00_11205 [Aggregatimonas sangjinii]